MRSIRALVTLARRVAGATVAIAVTLPPGGRARARHLDFITSFNCALFTNRQINTGPALHVCRLIKHARLDAPCRRLHRDLHEPPPERCQNYRRDIPRPSLLPAVKGKDSRSGCHRKFVDGKL